MSEVLRTRPRREFVREVLAQNMPSDISSWAVSQHNDQVSAAAPGREGPSSTHVCRLENGRGQGNTLYPLLTHCCESPSVAGQGEASPGEAQLVSGPGFMWVCTACVRGVRC